MNIERLFTEIPVIQNDFRLLINNNQWLTQLINEINQDTLSPVEIYRLFRKFTNFLPEFVELKSNISDLIEKYFWILPDESIQRDILSIKNGLNVLYNLTITIENNLHGLPLRDVFHDLSLVTNRLQGPYNVPYSIVPLLQRARLFQDPTVTNFVSI